MSGKLAERRPVPETPAGWSVEQASVVVATDYRAGAPRPALVLTQRWPVGVGAALAVMSAIWNAIAVGWFVMLLDDVAESGTGILFAAPLFLCSFLQFVVGGGLTYIALAMLVNRTTLRIEDGVASTRNGPLPWRGARRLTMDGVDRVVARRTTEHLRGNDAWSVVLGEGEPPVVLLERLSEEHARFVAARVTEHCGLERE